MTRCMRSILCALALFCVLAPASFAAQSRKPQQAPSVTVITGDAGSLTRRDGKINAVFERNVRVTRPNDHATMICSRLEIAGTPQHIAKATATGQKLVMPIINNGQTYEVTMTSSTLKNEIVTDTYTMKGNGGARAKIVMEPTEAGGQTITLQADEIKFRMKAKAINAEMVTATGNVELISQNGTQKITGTAQSLTGVIVATATDSKQTAIQFNLKTAAGVAGSRPHLDMTEGVDASFEKATVDADVITVNPNAESDAKKLSADNKLQQPVHALRAAGNLSFFIARIEKDGKPGTPALFGPNLPKHQGWEGKNGEIVYGYEQAQGARSADRVLRWINTQEGTLLTLSVKNLDKPDSKAQERFSTGDRVYWNFTTKVFFSGQDDEAITAGGRK